MFSYTQEDMQDELEKQNRRIEELERYIYIIRKGKQLSYNATTEDIVDAINIIINSKKSIESN